jgi:hypothetical protein
VTDTGRQGHDLVKKCIRFEQCLRKRQQGDRRAAESGFLDPAAQVGSPALH